MLHQTNSIDRSADGPHNPRRFFRSAENECCYGNGVALVFTDSAAAKVRELIEEEGNPGLKLRVFVTGGGCSGFQYGFTFDEEVSEDDTTLDKNGVTLLIDPMSYQYLVGAEIDYSEGLEGSGS